MKKIIASVIALAGGLLLTSPAIADETPSPIACAVDSDGHSTCEDVPVVDATDTSINETLIPIDAPVCTDDISACQRGQIMYDKNISQTAIHAEDTHQHETWWDIFTDPNHIAAELGWTIIQDFVVLWLLYGVVFKKCILPKLTNKIHAEIDKEHGIEHE